MECGHKSHRLADAQDHTFTRSRPQKYLENLDVCAFQCIGYQNIFEHYARHENVILNGCMKF